MIYSLRSRTIALGAVLALIFAFTAFLAPASIFAQPSDEPLAEVTAGSETVSPPSDSAPDKSLTKDEKQPEAIKEKPQAEEGANRENPNKKTASDTSTTDKKFGGKELGLMLIAALLLVALLGLFLHMSFRFAGGGKNYKRTEVLKVSNEAFYMTADAIVQEIKATDPGFSKTDFATDLSDVFRDIEDALYNDKLDSMADVLSRGVINELKFKRANAETLRTPLRVDRNVSIRHFEKKLGKDILYVKVDPSLADYVTGGEDDTEGESWMLIRDKGSKTEDGSFGWFFADVYPASEWFLPKDDTFSIEKYMEKDSSFSPFDAKSYIESIFWRMRSVTEGTMEKSVLAETVSDEALTEFKSLYESRNAASFYDSDFSSVTIEVANFDEKGKSKIYASLKWFGKAVHRKHQTQRKVYVQQSGVARYNFWDLYVFSKPAATSSAFYDSPSWKLEKIVPSEEGTVPGLLNQAREAFKETAKANNIAVPEGKEVRRYNKDAENIAFFTGNMTVSGRDSVRWAVAAMMADGIIDSEEMEIIHSIADKKSVSRKEVEEIKNEIEKMKDPISTLLAESIDKDMQDDLLTEVIRVVIADGKITSEEQEVLYTIAAKLDLSHEELDERIKAEQKTMLKVASNLLKKFPDAN